MFAWQTLDPNITAQVIRRLLRPLLVRAGRGLNKQFQADDMLTEVRQLPANTSAGLFAELPEKDRRRRPVTPGMDSSQFTDASITLSDDAAAGPSRSQASLPPSSFPTPAAAGWFAGDRRRFCVLASPRRRIPAPGCV